MTRCINDVSCFVVVTVLLLISLFEYFKLKYDEVCLDGAVCSIADNFYRPIANPPVPYCVTGRRPGAFDDMVQGYLRFFSNENRSDALKS